MKYLMIILISFLIASAVSVFGVFISQFMETAHTDMMYLPYGIAIAFNLFLALATFPVFLNLRARVSGNFLLSALSFFALPLVIMIYLTLSLEEEVWTGVLFCIPYFVVLSVFFVRFRNQNDGWKSWYE